MYFMKTLTSLFLVLSFCITASAQKKHSNSFFRAKKQQSTKENFQKDALVKPMRGIYYSLWDAENQEWTFVHPFTRTYDALGNITSEIYSENGEPSIMYEYEYDQYNNRVELRVFLYNNGAREFNSAHYTSRTYDNMGRITSYGDSALVGTTMSYTAKYFYSYPANGAVIDYYFWSEDTGDYEKAYRDVFSGGSATGTFTKFESYEVIENEESKTGTLENIVFNQLSLEKDIYELLYADYTLPDSQGRIKGIYTDAMHRETMEQKIGPVYQPLERETYNFDSEKNQVSNIFEENYNVVTSTFDSRYEATNTYEYSGKNITRNLAQQATFPESPEFTNVDLYTFEDFQEVNGISDVRKINVSVFPNPFTDRVQVIAPVERADISVTDITGKELVFMAAQPGNTSISLAALPSGIYFIRIQSEQGYSLQKLIK
jgi:hypothetical protein